MRKLQVQSPSIVKKTHGKNLKQDKEIKRLLFGKSKNKKPTNPTKNVANLLNWLAWFFGLLLLFVFLNLKFNVYEKISNFILPPSQDFTVGTLNITSEITPNMVYFNNENLGQTPIKDYTLPPGNYTVDLKSALKFAPDAHLTVPFTIVSKNATIIKAQVGPSFRTSSYLVIYATPSVNKQLLVLTHKPNAKVYLNDILIGTTPLQYDKLPNAPKVQLKIEQEGFKPMTMELSLYPDVTIHVEAKLYQYVLNLDK